MTMGYVAAAISLIGSAISATASIEQGQTAKKVSDANATAQKQTAISTEDAAAQQAADAQLKAKRVAASGVAAAGAGGVDPTTGTVLTLSGQTAEFGELDSLRIINNASRTAWGYNASASIDQYQGGQAQTAGYIGAGGTLLSGAGSAYFGGAKAGLWGTAS